MRFNFLAGTALLALAFIQPGFAADASLSDAQLTMLLSRTGIGFNMTYEQVLAALTRPIRLYDMNGDGLSRDEIEAADEITAAAARAQRAQMFLRADLNNDLQVTRPEYDLVARNYPFSSAPGSDAFAAADTNHDGVLNWQEMTAPPPDQVRYQNSGTTDALIAQTLAIDPTPATNFTIADAKTATDGLFQRLDLNHDDILEPNEIQAARAPLGNFSNFTPARPVTCVLPAVCHPLLPVSPKPSK